jgi:hypothetical protein
MNTVKLKHAIARHGKRVEHFYDGILMAEDGIIEIPIDREPWIKRSWITGYNLSPSGKRLWTWQHVLEEIQEQNAVEAPKPAKKKSAPAPEPEMIQEKKEDADEGADSGRQPED